jgi:heme-degrading monooxygenase HmoA
MIQVEIDRWVAEGMLEEAKNLIKEMRTLASSYPGFLTGSIFRRLDDHHHCVSVGQWNDLEDWERWFNSEERRNLAAKISPMLDEPPTKLIFEPF